jgi:hypothetical protein
MIYSWRIGAKHARWSHCHPSKTWDMNTSGRRASNTRILVKLRQVAWQDIMQACGTSPRPNSGRTDIQSSTAAHFLLSVLELLSYSAGCASNSGLTLHCLASFIYWKRIVSKIQFTNKLERCKIWGFHGGDYEEWCLLGCYAVWLL